MITTYENEDMKVYRLCNNCKEYQSTLMLCKACDTILCQYCRSHDIHSTIEYTPGYYDLIKKMHDDTGTTMHEAIVRGKEHN